MRQKEECDRRGAEERAAIDARGLKERVKTKLVTPQKLYNCPKEASARLHRKQHLKRSRVVIVQLPVVVLLLRRVPQLPQLCTTAAAAKLLYAKI